MESARVRSQLQTICSEIPKKSLIFVLFLDGGAELSVGDLLDGHGHRLLRQVLVKLLGLLAMRNRVGISNYSPVLTVDDIGDII